MNVTRVLGAIGLGVGVALTATGAGAQSWPERPVKLILGFSAGGTIDVVARIIGERLQARLGQPFPVENRTGANGMIAAAAVARAEPDGYSVFVSNASTITLNPTFFKNLSYDPKRDFAPVAMVLTFPLVLVVNPENPKSSGMKTLSDLVAAAKAAPGQVPYGSTGNGTINQLAFELLSQRAGIKMSHLPYKGVAPAQAALLSREVTVIFDTLTGVPQIKAGKLRALAVSSAERVSSLPDVPTIAELGFPGFDMGAWAGFLVPKATPKAIVDKLSREILAVIQEPEVRSRLEPHGSITPLPPGKFDERIGRETAELADVVAKAGIKAD
jgi:tripartite-type tricarboxylate transporter receptor subunit TctC